MQESWHSRLQTRYPQCATVTLLLTIILIKVKFSHECMTNIELSKVRFVYIKRLFVKLSNVIYNLIEIFNLQYPLQLGIQYFNVIL